MQFFSDLDGFTIFWTVVVVALAFVYLRLLWESYDGRWPDKKIRTLGTLLGAGIFCFVPAYNAYCPDADQPHIPVTGVVVPFKTYTYSENRSRYTGILACIGPCGSTVPLLAFNESATDLLNDRVQSQPLTVIYLARKQDAAIGGGYSMRAHPVVEMDTSDKGKRIFYVDTSRHWPRVIVLVSDALVGVFAFLICIRSGRSQSISEEDGNTRAALDAVKATPHGLIGIDLDGERRNKP